MAPNMCKVRCNQFCFCCAKYVQVKNRKVFNSTYRSRYMQAFGKKSIKNVDKSYTPDTLCPSCQKRIGNILKTQVRDYKPAKWHRPADDHADCYLCAIKITVAMRRKPQKATYPVNLNCELPSKMEVANGPTTESDDEDSDDDE